MSKETYTLSEAVEIWRELIPLNTSKETKMSKETYIMSKETYNMANEPLFTAKL